VTIQTGRVYRDCCPAATIGPRDCEDGTSIDVPLVTRARIMDGRLAVAVGRLCGFVRGGQRYPGRPKAVIMSAASKAAMSTSPPRSMSSTLITKGRNVVWFGRRR
jgi:hypothetical protein